MDTPETVITAIGAFFLVTTWVSTTLRLYVKAFLTKNIGAEDYLAALALALFTASVGIALKGIHVSGGKRFAYLTLAQIQDSMKWWFLLELFYTVTISVIRASIAVFLLRITTIKSQIIIIWTVLTIITAYSAFYFFFVIFQCNPPSAFWTEVGGNSAFCVKASIFGSVTYAHSALGALSDWVLALIPVFLVAGLQMNIRTKISVSIVLGLGGIAAIAVLVRIPYVKILVNSTDFLYDCTNVVIWTSIEPGLGLTVASMATLRPLFQAFLGRTRLFTNSRAPKANSGYGKSSRSHSRSKFSISIPFQGGYIRSGSKSGPGDSELGFADGSCDFEMKNPNVGTVTTVINSPGFEGRSSSEEEAMKKGHRHKRSESQSRLKRIAEWGNLSRVNSIEDGRGSEGSGDGVPLTPIQIRKTVEVRTQSGVLS